VAKDLNFVCVVIDKFTIVVEMAMAMVMAVQEGAT